MSNKLTTNDAAKILNKAPATVLYYTKNGRLKAERTQSGIRLFDQADVEQFARELQEGERAS
jgi:DNA-binding transcriptional MerR regulator